MKKHSNITPTEEREATLRRRRKLRNGISKKSLFSRMKKHGKERYLFGYRVQQNHTSMWVLDCVLSSYRPDLIVELGTGFGVLTTYFSVYGMISNFDVEVISLDLAPSPIKDNIEAINKGKTQLLQMDIYDPKTVKFITDKINKAERPFLLVDGKDPKSKEVNLYAKDLKEGVIILAHDASLEGNKRVPWGFKEDKINWDIVEKHEPFYSWSVEGDTRMLCMKTKKIK